MSLKASDLANEMVAQLPTAWLQVKGTPFPGGSTDDAKIMFLAVARGLLNYLEAHQADSISQINVTGLASNNLTVQSVNWNTDLS